MRLVYSLFTYLLAPLLPLYLLKRGKKNPAYLRNWNERFGIKLENSSSKPIIWLHSVSVGETRAMQKLVELISNELSNYQILITTMTPTGRQTAQTLYPQAIVHYIPYDISFCVKSFYKNFKPKIGIIMETEIWPNLIHFAEQSRTCLYLVNARLSNRSFRGYNHFKLALLPILNKFNGILCQDANTENNFLKLGYNQNLQTVGNTKFDLVFNDSNNIKIKELEQLVDGRKIITFASTRNGEEEILLNNIDLNQNVIYLFIPRHPERFIELENLLIKNNIAYCKRSDNRRITSDCKVIIGDSMGEMLVYYALSYLVVIGGSFKDFGGQNPIEAIYMNKPVIFGKSMFNFSDVAKNSVDIGCAIQIDSPSELKKLVNNLIEDDDKYNALKTHCSEFIDKYCGASEKIFNIIFKNVSCETSDKVCNNI